MALLTKNKSKLTLFLKRTAMVSVALALALTAMRSTLISVRIEGNSMLPAFSSGDSLLMQQRFFKPEIGEIYSIDKSAIPDKYQISMSLVKRVVAGPGDELVFNSLTGEPLSKNSETVNFTSLEGVVKSFLLESHEQDSYGETLRVIPAYNEVLALKTYRLQPDQNFDQGRKKLFLEKVRHYPFLQELSQAGNSHIVKLIVPAGHYFVLSDNLSSNLDSRYFGFIPESAVTHRMLRVKGG